MRVRVRPHLYDNLIYWDIWNFFYSHFHRDELYCVSYMKDSTWYLYCHNLFIQQLHATPSDGVKNIWDDSNFGETYCSQSSLVTQDPPSMAGFFPSRLAMMAKWISQNNVGCSITRKLSSPPWWHGMCCSLVRCEERRGNIGIFYIHVLHRVRKCSLPLITTTRK